DIEMTFHPESKAEVFVTPNEITLRIPPREEKSQIKEALPLRENRDSSFFSKVSPWLGWMAFRFLLEWISKHTFYLMCDSFAGYTVTSPSRSSGGRPR